MKNRMAFVGLAVTVCLICGCAVSPLYGLFYTGSPPPKRPYRKQWATLVEPVIELQHPWT